jgi:hypothetical protein
MEVNTKTLPTTNRNEIVSPSSLTQFSFSVLTDYLWDNSASLVRCEN